MKIPAYIAKGIIMTNKEIAKQLHLSPSALSLIINNKPGVSDETRKRVLLQLQEMGQGHLIRQPSARPMNNNLGFIIYKGEEKLSDIHPFFLLLMETIVSHAKAYGYNILLNTFNERQPLEPQIKYLQEQQLKGAIIHATEMPSGGMNVLSRLNIPLIALDNSFPLLDCSSVSINNEMGTYQAVSHLIRHGCKRIGYLRSSCRINMFKERHTGYENALHRFSLTLAPEDIWTVPYTEYDCYLDIRGRLSRTPAPPLPDAFVCDDDLTAAGALRAFRELGYHLPDDISIIGFSNRPASENTIPALTTIHVSKSELAATAVDELLRLIENAKKKNSKSISRKIRIATSLISRDSVADKNI